MSDALTTSPFGNINNRINFAHIKRRLSKRCRLDATLRVTNNSKFVAVLKYYLTGSFKPSASFVYIPDFSTMWRVAFKVKRDRLI